jgi:type IV pilus assembly protein PilA
LGAKEELNKQKPNLLMIWLMEVSMKSFFQSLKRQDGFTLVELMVVVAIIGLLSAVAIPNFKKYQAKAKTSEAKLQLSAAYTAQQSFYSDYDSYALCLAYMGFNPVNEINQRIYVAGFGSNTAVVANIATILTANGAGGCTNANAADSSIFAAGKKTGTAAALTTFTITSIPTVVTENTFVIGAIGVVDLNFAALTGTTQASSFSINEAKKLIQTVAGY